MICDVAGALMMAGEGIRRVLLTVTVGAEREFALMDPSEALPLVMPLVELIPIVIVPVKLVAWRLVRLAAFPFVAAMNRVASVKGAVCKAELGMFVRLTPLLLLSVWIEVAKVGVKVPLAVTGPDQDEMTPAASVPAATL